MSEVVTIPPVSIVQGLEFYQRYEFEDIAGPVDLTDWQVEASLSRRPFDEPFWRAEIAAGTDGAVNVVIPADKTEGFDVLPILGGASSAVFQVKLVAPADEFSQVWQGPASVAGVFK